MIGDNRHQGISIHAPARGATVTPASVCQVDRDFNPRSREGSDNTIDKRGITMNISIHAPARGATVSTEILYLCSRFQSMLPRGERQDHPHTVWEHPHFNPRSREGSDSIIIMSQEHTQISIHAPARGATQNPQYGLRYFLISIHAPARGATKSASILTTSSTFQSTLPRGERRR